MSYTVVTCPTCGGEMNSRSKKCKHCTGSKTVASRPSQIDTCPICGGPKNKTAKTCKGCQYKDRKRTCHPRRRVDYPDLALVPDTWWLAFIGFFMGEGSVRLYKCGHSLPQVGLSMSLRADDAAVMEDICTHIGGILYDEVKPGLNPMVKWAAHSAGHTETIVRVMLRPEFRILPAKKWADLELVLEYIDWRKSKPYHLSPDDREIALSYPDRLKAIHVCKVR